MKGALAVLLLAAQAHCLSGRAKCQDPSKSKDWRANCPHATLLVGPGTPIPNITYAISLLPNNTTPYVLLIKPGIYQGQVNITRRGPVTLLGTTVNPNTHLNNSVSIIHSAATGTRETGSRDNAFTSTLTVAPNLDASLTGRGPTGHTPKQPPPPGNPDFRAYNIDFVNDYKPYSAGPSLAVSVGYVNAGFYFCGIRSYQDTVYVGKNANAYFYGGEIAGSTDFLYGFGTAWIQKARLALRGCGGAITAWKGTNSSVPGRQGVYVHEASVGRANSSLRLTGQCSLGRPWNELHRSVFAYCDLDDSIAGAGYRTWNGREKRVSDATFMAEYANKGAGWDEKARAAAGLSKVLTMTQYYMDWDAPKKVFLTPEGKTGNTGWIDFKPEAA